MTGLWHEESATPTEVLFEARDRIEELEEIKLTQGSHLIRLTFENILLTEHADKEMGGRYGRLSDAIHAIEHFSWRCGRSGGRVMPEILVPLLQDAIDYADAGHLGMLLAWALRDCARYAAQDAARDAAGGIS